MIVSMIYRFGAFALDLDRLELHASGSVCPLEPQVFALLALLVENRDRVISKEEIIEKVWDGRIVSDAALASRVKSARRALGDDGKSQRFIRTIQRRGLRFVAAVSPESGVTATRSQQGNTGPEPADKSTASGHSQPSLAVLPFTAIGNIEPYAALAEAVPQDLITDLSRLRWLWVTARCSSFRLSSDTSFDEIGRLLNVRYSLIGTIDIANRRLAITVELADTRTARVVWAERFTGPLEDVHFTREEIRSRILAALEIEIPLHEAARARLVATENLDAWAAYHLGLQHMYRFNRVDNAAAAVLFEKAIAADPHFARAHAGRSFLHFQTAFLQNTNAVQQHVAAARHAAERGVELDPLDPFVNFTMGRSFWLEGDLESSLIWLERSTELHPNYAEGVYARAWTEVLSGNAGNARQHVDIAMRLSPLDPLYYAMLGTRGFVHLARGEDAEAAAWVERAGRSPGAHVMIAMIATAAHALNGDIKRASGWAANVRERNPALTREAFFRAFPMTDEVMRARISKALQQFGF